MSTIFFALAALIASVALAAYLLGPKAVACVLQSIYRETKAIIGTVARRGWRPYIPWCFGFILTAIGVRLMLGLPLPDSVTLGVILGPLGAIAAHATQVRSGDYRAGVANGAPTATDSPLEGRMTPTPA